jgi:hypothetical protein
MLTKYQIITFIVNSSSDKLPWLLNGLHPGYKCHNYPMALLAPDNECLDKYGNNPSKNLGEKYTESASQVHITFPLEFLKGRSWSAPTRVKEN